MKKISKNAPAVKKLQKETEKRKLSAKTKKMSTRGRISRRSREKGRDYESECVNDLKPLFPEAKRHLEFQKEEAAGGYDIENTDEYKFQCKRGHHYKSPLAIEEVKCDREYGEVPVLLTRADKKESLAIMYMSDFIDLVKRAKENE